MGEKRSKESAYSMINSVTWTESYCPNRAFLRVLKGGSLLLARAAKLRICCWLEISKTVSGLVTSYASWHVSNSQWALGGPPYYFRETPPYNSGRRTPPPPYNSEPPLIIWVPYSYSSGVGPAPPLPGSIRGGAYCSGGGLIIRRIISGWGTKDFRRRLIIRRRVG